VDQNRATDNNLTTVTKAGLGHRSLPAMSREVVIGGTHARG
jgi:hypothetical protein